MIKKIVLNLCVVVALFVLSGCSVDIGALDEKDQTSSYARRAADRYEEGDSAGAVELYRKALEEDPGLARAHLDLALVLHDSQKDYVGAVYHYRRYIELRPESQKKKMIENRMRLAGQSFAGSVLGNREGGNVPIIKSLEEEKKTLLEKIDLLERKNAALKDKILQKQSLNAPSAGSGEKTSRKGRRTYQVRKADTLQGIALLFYNDAGRWEDIYRKNKSIIKDPVILVVGQVLEIP